jgi:5-methylcytosine-specific restriction endonuclease McrA
MNPNKKLFIINTLRRASYKWKQRNDAILQARLSRGMYRCAICKQGFKRKDIRIDHVDPVIPISGWEGFESYIERLLPDSSSQFQILCVKDHQEKTNKENAARRQYKQEKEDA